eukprot:768311-Hanusia_phi.AAC.1
MGSVAEFVLGNTYSINTYIRVGNDVYEVVKSSGNATTENVQQADQPPQTFVDGYEYKFITGLKWTANDERIEKDDYVVSSTLDRLYFVLTEPCSAMIEPTGTTPNTVEATTDGYEYLNLGSGFEWKANATYNVNDYIWTIAAPSSSASFDYYLYKIASINDATLTQPTTLTVGNKEMTPEGYEYEYLGPYQNFTAGSITLSEDDLVYNGTDLYQVRNIIRTMQTCPTTTSTETLDVGIKYQFYGSFRQVETNNNFSIRLDLPYTMTDTAKLGVAHLSIHYDPYDSKSNATYSTDRFELYSQSLSAKNIAYSKNGTNRGTPIYRTYIDGTSKTSINIHNDLWHNSLDIRNASAWVKAGGHLQFNVNMPLKNQYTGYEVGNEGLPSNCKFNIRLVIFDADEEEVQHPEGIQGPFRAPNFISTS